jgi:tetratricopeptide (TPR) repeat protein
MAAHPGQAAWLLVKKFGWAFHAKHVALPYSYPFYQYDWPTFLRFLVIGPWLLVPLGLVGLLFAAPTKERASYLIFASFVPLYAAAVAVFLISERYRLPLLVPLVIGSGAAIDWAIRARSKAAGAAVVFSVIAFAANYGTPHDDGRWDEGLRLADQYVVLGQFDEAEKWIAKLETTASHPGMAHHAVGLQFVESGQPARAMPHFERALEAGLPLPAEDWLRIGRIAAADLNAPPSAEPFFARAAAIAPANAAARLQHGANLIALGRFDDAARELAEAARLDPQSAAALAQLAYAEARLNRIDEARTHVRMALAIDPNEPMAGRLAQLILKKN